jgi:hypothetical protein
MALDYDGVDTGIFYRGGRIISQLGAHYDNATIDLPAQLLTIADPFEAADMTDQITGLYGAIAGMQSQETANQNALASFFDRILLDRVSVAEQLGLANPTISQVLDALFRQMESDSKTVKRNTVTVGSVTAGSGNVGNGTILVTKLLDGYNKPAGRSQACTRYAGLSSELAVTETMRFQCIRDSYRDGATAGAETFSWDGEKLNAPFSHLGEGSGKGPALSAINNKSLLTNSNFESFSSNTPTSWTIASGTAGTHVFQTTTSGQYYRGSSALKLTGNGSQNPIRLTQVPRNLKARRMYCLTARVKASATPSVGDLTIQLSGTGYTPGGTEKINVVAASLTTSWVLHSAFILTPSSLPSDLLLELKITGALDNAKSVYLDDVYFVEVPYHGGVGAVVVPGSTPFVVDDKFSVALTQDDAGYFQKFFRQKYGFQLPSAASPTISETLVTGSI